MTTERWQQIEKLYYAVLNQDDSERAEFLEKACAGDEELRREVAVLLKANQRAGGFLSSPALEVAAQELAHNQPPSWLGRQIGAYQILTLLGAGGMGEVYRAKDTRLNRTVAIKVLPAEASDRADLHQRFEREARAISSLSHPHICALYDIGQQDGVDFLVMEYLKGQTLAQRLTKGALPLDQVLHCASEIASALDLAHRQGVVHRDLKPGNIMLTKSGAKLMDFGLAKLHLGTNSVWTGLSAVTKEAEQQGSLTAEGTIMGTLPYMAPEQLEGKAADARSDIFAFGAILYEMITGRPAFTGQSQASLIAAILDHDPRPISTEQPMTPPALDHVVKRCLRKDPVDRWQTAHDLTQELKWIAEVVSQTGVATTFTQRKNRQRLAWIVAACAMLLALGLAAAYFHRAPTELRTLRFTILPPEETNFSQESNLDISPDGRHLAFSTFDSSGRTRLWVRPLDSVSAQPLPGSDDGSLSFWSPDGRFIGFFAQGKLKKLALSGGSTQTLCDAPSGWGGTWNRDGVIVFAPNIYSPLYRVSAAGGEPSPVTTLDQSRQETRHSFPRFLPDGRHFLYLVKSTIKRNTGIYVGSLDSKDTRRLLGTEFNAAYAPPGYLLFVRDGVLMAQRFDTKDLQMTGEPYPVVQQIGQFFAGAYFSISENGVLVYWGGAQTRKAKLVWLDRAGKELQSIGTPGYYRFPSLSPDETRVAVQQLDPQTGKGDIWLLDLLRGTSSRFTFDPSDESSPIWSPDGSRIVFASEQGGSSALCEKSSSGASSEKVLLKLNDFISADDWSLDGRFIAYSATSADSPKTLTDLWVLPLFGERRPILYLQAEFWEMQARPSPDGRWIAYESTESGRPEVYVQSFPALGGKVKVSTQGGADPRWRHDGKELFYVAADHELMAVEVRIGSTFQAGVPKALLRMRVISYDDVYKHYTVSKDGQRFLVVTPTEEVNSNPITVVINWTAELRR